jgi:quinol monooxygenase YgiN
MATVQFVALQPYFEVEEGKLDEFKAVWAAAVAKVKAEEKSLYYGFTFNGNIAHCREGYADAAGVLAHLENVGEELGKVSDPCIHA